MADKNTIINQLVGNAADIMEAKGEYNELVASMMEKKGDAATAKRLRATNARIAEAVALIREHEGCWT